MPVVGSSSLTSRPQQHKSLCRAGPGLRIDFIDFSQLLARHLTSSSPFVFGTGKLCHLLHTPLISFLLASAHLISRPSIPPYRERERERKTGEPESQWMAVDSVHFGVGNWRMSQKPSKGSDSCVEWSGDTQLRPHANPTAPCHSCSLPLHLMMFGSLN
jgi:hypothetical protein